MDSSLPPESLILDLGVISIEQANEQLHACEAKAVEVTILGESQRHTLGIGLEKPIKMQFQGNLGDYCLVNTREIDIEVHGSIGCCAGEAIRSGTIVIRGNVGVGFGAFGTGGLVATYGSADDRCGVGLAGADLIVRGSVGAQAAFGMKDGTLVIGGSAGKELGRGMKGGTIFLRGRAESMASTLEKVRMRESEKMRLGLLMLKAGIIAKAIDFSVYRPVNAV